MYTAEQQAFIDYVNENDIKDLDYSVIRNFTVKTGIVINQDWAYEYMNRRTSMNILCEMSGLPETMFDELLVVDNNERALKIFKSTINEMKNRNTLDSTCIGAVKEIYKQICKLLNVEPNNEAIRLI